jgi:branched-chain amino acid transport system ATP-binding protein
LTTPKLLLLDEPTPVLSLTETANIMKHIQEIRKKGVTLLLIEHNMKVIMNICDRILVLNFGNKIAEGTSHEVGKNENY